AIAERLLLEGDSSEAVRFLRQHLKRADDELGSIPHAGLKRLLKRIEAGTALPAILPSPETSPHPSRVELFVGRENELGQLEALWAQARKGARQSVLLAGPAGIGKSSLF